MYVVFTTIPRSYVPDIVAAVSKRALKCHGQGDLERDEKANAREVIGPSET